VESKGEKLPAYAGSREHPGHQDKRGNNLIKQISPSFYFGGENTPLFTVGMKAAERTRPKGYPVL